MISQLIFNIFVSVAQNGKNKLELIDESSRTGNNKMIPFGHFTGGKNKLLGITHETRDDFKCYRYHSIAIFNNLILEKQ